MSISATTTQPTLFNSPNLSPIIPLQEIVAYEALWTEKDSSFRKLAQLFSKNPGTRPSDFADSRRISELLLIMKNVLLGPAKSFETNILINGTFDYPQKLKDAKDPVELLYYTGTLELLYTRCISVVGTRNASLEGIAITDDVVKSLVRGGFTIMSGLASGIDTQAHLSALNANGKTVAVIGTPLTRVYPQENLELQRKIAKEHLLVSQVPFYRYSQQTPILNKQFFLERNKTMSALSEATLIIEAGETSGTLTQAVAAIYQKRKLFIWETCLKKGLSWPQRFADKGAIIVNSYQQIRDALNKV